MALPPLAPVRPEASTPFEMTFGHPAPQRRVTVFFRPILAIPQLIVLYFINIAASVLVFLGWFAALFTGRLPESFATFILGYLRWRGRVDGYIFLLTDKYPPFSLQPETDYPIDVAVQTGRLNRLAVLFRYFIAIPAAIAVGLLYVGLSVFWIVTWVATLIKGEVPSSLFQANAAALRFAYRFEAYFVMLTSFYPAEVMGDEGPTGPTAFDPTASASPSPFPHQPPMGVPPVAPMAGGVPSSMPLPVPDADAPPSSLGVPPTPPPPGVPPAPPPPGVPPAPPPPGVPASASTPVPPPPASPGFPAGPAFSPPSAPPPPVPPAPVPAPGVGVGASGWRLVLSPAARKLVVTYFIVGALGLVAYVGILVALTSGTVSTTSQAITAQNDLINAYNTLGRQSQTFGTTTAACPSAQTSAGTECLAGADAQLAADLQTYQHVVSTTDFPSEVASEVAAVISASGAASAKLEQLAQLGTNPQAYVSAINSAGLQAAFQKVDSTTRSLNSALLTL